MSKIDDIKKNKEAAGQNAFQQANTLELLGGKVSQPFANPVNNQPIPRNSSKVTGTAMKMTNICLRLDPYLYEEIKAMASIEQRSLNTMIAVAIKAYVTDPENEKKINQFRRIG